MTYYYKIDENNVFWYSGVEFDGSTASSSVQLPITSSVVAIRPYDDNYVQWDESQFPGRLSTSASGMTDVDLSGIELVAKCSSWPNYSWVGSGTFTWPRNSTEWVYCGATVSNSLLISFVHVNSVEYGEDILPDLPHMIAIQLSGLNTTKLTFKDLSSATRVSLDRNTTLRTVVLPDMPSLFDGDSMFSGDTALRDLTIGRCNCVSGYQMFLNCSSLRELDLTNITTLNLSYSRSQTYNVFDMFKGCSSLETIKMPKHFAGNSGQNMFSGCTSLTNIELLGFTATNTWYMFSGCISLESVTIDMPKVTTTTSMFNNCSSLKTINCSNNLSNVSGSGMFSNCISLIGGNGTQYNSSYITASRAIVDGEGGEAGYFTYDIANNYYNLTALVPNSQMGYIENDQKFTRLAENVNATLKFNGLYGWGIDYWIRYNSTAKVWVIQPMNSDGSITITMDSDTLIYAIPKYTGSGAAQFTVALSSTPEGVATMIGAGSYAQGSTIFLDYYLNDFTYQLAGWYRIIGDQETFLTNSPILKIEEIGSDWTVVAKFEKKPSSPYDDGGYSGTGGGEGTYTQHFDLINFEDTIVDALDGGLIGIYRMSADQIKTLSRELWQSNFYQDLLKILRDPMDTIISLSLMPITAAGTLSSIKAGNYVFPTAQGYKLTNQITNIDLGSISIPLYWGNFMDYNPHTKFELYLPYCSSVSLDADEIVGKTINIKYKIDLLTGNCTAFVIIDNNVRYQINGNVATQIPLSASRHNSMGLIASLTAFAGGAIGALTGGGAAPIAAMAGSIISSANYYKDNIQHAGSMSGSTGMLGVQCPVLYVKRARQNVPTNFGHFNGYASNITYRLGNLRGFTKVAEIHLDGINATSEELTELENLLKEGVIINDN